MAVGVAQAVQHGEVEQRPGSRAPRALWAVAGACAAIGVVLRAWDLGGHDVTFDEAFTGAASHRGFADLVAFLRSSDAHPPLDYLVRIPFAAAGDDALLRVPSALWSLGTLAVLALWMRSKGAFGAFTLMVASFLPFLVLHGREARMYSLTAFLGVAVAFLAERWLERPSRWLALGISSGALLAALTHSAALVPLACLMLLPGLRRDRDDWFLRACLGGAAAVWAFTWGPAFLDQLDGTAAGWIPLTSASWAETAAAALVSPRRAFLHISAGLLLVGGGLLVLRQHRLARVALVTCWLPFALIALLGIEFHVLLPRSFAFGIWVPIVSLAAVLEEIRRRLSAVGTVLGCALLAMVLVPSSLEHVQDAREHHVALEEVRARLRAGDRVSISPVWFAPVIEWEFAAKDGFRIIGPDGKDRFVVADATSAPSGRTHLLDHARLADPADLLSPTPACGPRLDTHSWILRCHGAAP